MAGTTQSAKLGFLGFTEESGFAQSVDTYDQTVQVRDVSLTPGGLVQEMVPRGGVYNRMNQGDNHVPGTPLGSTLSFTMDLYGHGSATNGAISKSPLATLLGHAVGASIASTVGGTCTDTAANEGEFVSSNVSIDKGEMVRIGAIGDGKGNAQAYVSDDANDITPFELINDTQTVTVNADPVYAMQLISPEDATTTAHLTSDSSGANNTLRFLVATGTQQWWCYGCACTGIAFNGLNPGEVPSVTFTFGMAAWADANETFPTATASADFAPAPNANGSFQINAVGTQTRNLETIRNFSLSIDHQMLPLLGQGGNHTNQVVQGWVRAGSKPTVTFDVEAEDATTTPTYSSFWSTDPNSITNKYIVYTQSVVDGRAVAWHFPNLQPIANRPTMVDIDGLNYVTVTLEGVEGPQTASAKRRSPWRLGLG